MRRDAAPLLVLLLAAPLLAGCFGGDAPDKDAPTGALPYQGDAGLLARSVRVPEGASLVSEATGPVLEWLNASGPFSATFTLPEGASMVRFVASPPGDGTVSVAMSNNETGRRRCNQQSVVDLGAALTGPRSCSSIAAVDAPGTVWRVSASGANLLDARVEFYSAPLDGPAALVDWSQLSPLAFDINPTIGMYVPSFDGTRLWVELTLPVGDGPWPTIVSASPYNGQQGRIPDPGESGNVGTAPAMPAMWTYWTQDYAKRGYATLNVDVRGFGKSDGCVEVWGANEQQDQKFIVDWVADQAWSDGNVGFYGQSYVATTPVAAAVQAPEALKAIVAVAPVIDSYFDWHYGGVPNGESSLSPVSYQGLKDDPSQWAGYAQTDPEGFATDLPTILQYSTKGLCDPTLVPLANDPRAIHNAEFYDVRDFGARAKQVQAAVLYTQGFEDANVKSAMIPDWFNDIEAPKLGVFGHWLHQHPARMDAEALFLGWMDQYVKGRDLGIDAYPDAIVTVDGATQRSDAAWPPVGLGTTDLHLDFERLELSPDAGAGTQQLDMLPVSMLGDALPAGADTQVALSWTLLEDLPIVEPQLVLDLSLDGGNAMVYARLDEHRIDGTTRLLSWGMKNLALGDDYATYDPLVPGARSTQSLPFRPTEHIAAAGSTLTLTIRGVQAAEPLGTAPPQPGTLTLYGDGTMLTNHAVPLDDYAPIALTALP